LGGSTSLVFRDSDLLGGSASGFDLTEEAGASEALGDFDDLVGGARENQAVDEIDFHAFHRSVHGVHSVLVVDGRF